jgi:hypothetical protein
VDRLNHRFEAAQAAHPSSEAKNIWRETRAAAAKRLRKLREVTLGNYDVASAFVRFMRSLREERYISETYDKSQTYVRRAVEDAGTAQEAIIQFRED